MHHPHIDELRRFASGQLDAGHIDRLATHLEGCRNCVERLDSLGDDDPLVVELRRCGAPPEAPLPALPGRRIGGYRLREELGRGGMGIVYRAHDQRLKRDVALKLIPAGVHADPEQRRRMRQEAETIAVLRHPGIVQVYDVGEEAGVMYIALELLQPVGLTALGARHGPHWCAAVVRQVAETLHHAHRAGFVHRDIKPDNILLAPVGDILPWWTPEGGDDRVVPRLKITDFGLSKPLEGDHDLTRAGVLVGTPDYMAPEQLPDSPGPVGPAADIHALGAILYELLSGEAPFRRGSLAVQLARLRHDEPAPLGPAVPRDLETICFKCLRKNPAERYPSARALAEDLARFLQAEPIHARPPRLWERLLAWARRTPILAANLSAMVLFYGLHLFAMWVLQAPGHMGRNHHLLNLVFLGWLLALLVLETLHRSPRWRGLTEYLHVLLPMVLIQFENPLDVGPAYAPPDLLILVLISAALIRPTMHMLCFATVATQVAFTGYALVANSLGRPPYSVEHILFFNLLILLIGMMISLLLRQRGSMH